MDLNTSAANGREVKNHKKIKPLEITLEVENTQRIHMEAIGHRQHKTPPPRVASITVGTAWVYKTYQDQRHLWNNFPNQARRLINERINKPEKEDDKSKRTPPTDFPQVFKTTGFFPEVFRKWEKKNVHKYGSLINRLIAILFLRFLNGSFSWGFWTKPDEDTSKKCQREAQDKSQKVPEHTARARES